MTKNWYLLNSEIGHPMKLTSTGWHLLKGSVYILAEGSAYGQNQLWNAIDEGYTQVHDNLKYLTPGKLVISQEATSHARTAQQPRQQQQCIRLDLEPEEAADQTSAPKLPDNASRRQGKIACGKRLYRRAENEDNSVVLPEYGQAQALVFCACTGPM